MVVQTPELNMLCINCLSDKGLRSLCPQCGYDERKHKEHPLYLKPRTILKNQYVIGTTLGQGGFGITYIGQDLWLQKKVAIKEYLPVALATRDIVMSTIIPLKHQENTFSEGLQCFIDEARNLAKFDHHNIVRVINFFEENQTGYMVMDYLGSLSPMDILNQAGGCLPVDKALAIVLPILNALTEVHAQHIYHRDISIQNIRILTSGVPVLIDFGAARHIVGGQSHTLDLVLKHGYSPLEQYSGKGKIGAWTDIYACGALLYLIITGTLPPAATDRFCEDNLIAPVMLGITISSTVNNAIMRALAIKLEERFQTVFEFKAALLGTAPDDNTTIETLNAPKLQKKPKKNVAITIVSILMVLGGVFFYYQEDMFSSITPPLKPLIEQPRKVALSQPQKTSERKPLLEQPRKVALSQPQKTSERKPLLEQPRKVALSQPQKTSPLKPLIEQPRKVALSQPQKTSPLKPLFEQAQAQWMSYKLMTPAGDNAYETYQQILAMAPDNAGAQAGLLIIAKRYWKLSTKAIKAGKWTKSLKMIRRGLQVVPAHADLLALKQKVMAHLAAQKQAQARATAVQKLLTQAAQHLAKSQFQAANATYQEVFTIESDNKLAYAGLRQVAKKYLQLARTKRGSISSRLAFIDKGLYIFPDHQGLLTLKQKLNEVKLARQRELEAKLARQRELEAKQQRELEAKLARQRELEAKRQRELEAKRQRELEAKRQRELEAKRQRELEAKQARQRELEAKRQRELEAKRQRELEAKQARQRELEAKQARQRELEAKQARQRELETKQTRQRELEAKRQRELEAKPTQQRELEARPARQRELEEKRQRELEEKQTRQRELKARQTRQRELEAKQTRQRELKARQTRQRELEAKQTRQRELKAKRTQQKIDKLLKKARIQLAALRLTIPAGDNAYETYKKIFTIAPNYPKAKVGLVKIADQYERLARIKRNDLHQNLGLIERGLKVLPTHAGLKTLHKNITKQMQRVKVEPISKPRVTNVEPKPPPKPVAPPSRSFPSVSTVQNLLTIAQRHFETAQFEAASQTYKNILMIDSDNKIATAGLQRIAYYYELKAKAQLENLSNSLALVKKGLAAYPTQSLLILQAEIIRRFNEKRAAKPPKNIIFTPSF